MIIKTIGAWDFSQVDDRLFNHEGCVVDLGCADWEFCLPFIGKKRIIGVDPNAEPMEGAELYRGVIGPFTGKAKLSNDGLNSTVLTDKPDQATEVGMLSWPVFCAQFGIENVSLLKVNIEGAEYPLLAAMTPHDFKKIDQMALSFHDFVWPERKQATKALLGYVRNFYDVVQTADWGWFLCLLK